MNKKPPDNKKKKTSGKASNREVRILLPVEIFETYEQVARDQHISVAQVVARVAIEFVSIEKEAGDSRRKVLEANRFQRLETLHTDREGSTDLLGAPAAALYSEIFAQLLGFDRAKLDAFFANSTEDTSLINEKGFVFVGATNPEFRLYECYAEGDATAVFRMGEWPADIECRSGALRLLFSGTQFSGVPILVEFAPTQRFTIPPNGDCTLTLKKASTMLLRTYDSGVTYSNSAADFDKIASLVSELAQRQALEPLPGIEQKGLIIKLDTLV
jgi:hypothetical protein